MGALYDDNYSRLANPAGEEESDRDFLQRYLDKSDAK
jgi:hypothetical protein